MTDKKSFLGKYQGIILYGASLAVLLIVLRWLEFRFVLLEHSIELYIGFIAVIFTGLGIWLALKLSKPKVKTVVIEKELYITKDDDFVPNQKQINELEITEREMEVLRLLAKGLSNQEIAEKVFVSLSTVKTHNQNLFKKLDVKRRTQAVEKARQLRLIP